MSQDKNERGVSKDKGNWNRKQIFCSDSVHWAGCNLAQYSLSVIKRIFHILETSECN